VCQPKVFLKSKLSVHNYWRLDCAHALRIIRHEQRKLSPPLEDNVRTLFDAAIALSNLNRKVSEIEQRERMLAGSA
jgi:hypothetical protein